MTAPTSPPVDLAVLPELTGCDDADLLAELFDEFLVTADEAARLIDATVKAADLSGLKNAAHRVKSSARYVGAHHLGQISEALEHAAGERRIPEIVPLVQGWHQEWERVERFLDDYLGPQS